MTIHKDHAEKGQIIVIMSIGIIVLLSFVALTVDMGMYFLDRRQAQNAADTAALAGVLAKHYGTNCETDAINQAAMNGYTDGENVDVQVDCDYGEDGNYVLVTITSTSDTLLARLFGRENLTNEVLAEAHYTPGESGVTSSILGAALIALDPTSKDTFSLSGNSTLTTQGGCVFVNSSNKKAWTGSGNQTFTTDSGIQVVGGVDLSGNITLNTNITAGEGVKRSGNITVNGNILENQDVEALPFPPVDLVIAPPEISSPNCTNNGTMVTTGGIIWLTPGVHPKRTISGNNNIVFQPGNYCFSGDLSISGNMTITANQVKIFSNNKNITFSGNMTVNAKASLFLLNSGNFNIDGNAQLNLSDSTVYLGEGNFTLNGNDTTHILSDESTMIYLGSGNLHFNGNTEFICTNTTFYINEGDLTRNGNAKFSMDAPDDGIYAGLLIYMPYTNASTVTINGNSGSALTGSIIVPGASVKVNGNSNSAVFNSRIIGYDFKFTGNSTMHIVFNAEDNYEFVAGEDPYIDLTR